MSFQRVSRQLRRGIRTGLVIAALAAFLCAAGWVANWGTAGANPVSAAPANQLTTNQTPPNQAQPGQDPPGATTPDQDQAEKPQLPEIKDEPKGIDPAKFMPQSLSQPITVDFNDSSLRELAEWLQSEIGLTVQFDMAELAQMGIPLGEPFTDKANNEPVYLLLNRLSSKDLGWYMEDDVVWITSQTIANARMFTESYSVGDLFASGFQEDALIDSITSATAIGESQGWLDEGTGEGTVECLGDILFVRQTLAVQWEVAGLLDGLRDHGRQTFIADPPRHQDIRRALDENITVEFKDEPLANVVAGLAEKSGLDVRMDVASLKSIDVRERTPVSLELKDHKLRTVLDVLDSRLEVAGNLEGGILWIAANAAAETHLKTAIYDVRDLCQNRNESEALKTALTSQTESGWLDEGTGPGVIKFPKPGTMVLAQSEDGHREVSTLLAMYRNALANSAPRDRGPDPKQEVKTVYYRMPQTIAMDLYSWLPRMVQPESWKDSDHPDVAGSIQQFSSAPDLIDAKGRSVVDGNGDRNATAMVVPQMVLKIEQTAENHEEIARIIARIREGDKVASGGGGFGGGGFGGGGFGGGGAGGFGSGYFAPRPQPQPKPRPKPQPQP